MVGADAYIHGLVAGNTISDDVAAACRDNLARCQRRHKRHRWIWFLILLIVFAGGSTWVFKRGQQINAERASFMADSQGFPWLKELAREQYKIGIVPTETPDNLEFAPAALTYFLSAPAAEMYISPGYCRLHMLPGKVLDSFNAIGQVDHNIFVQGVMLHEFAHCLDVSRDMPTFDQKVIGTRSLAPTDATKVKDLESYLEAEKTDRTKLWREAVADTFVVGYWKLTEPEIARDLIATLRRKRAEEADSGPTHATMCWIDQAAGAAKPSSIAALFKWADELRTSAQCELPYAELTQ